ncbi:MAG: hypothetical protein KGL19_14185 [Bacteroidota bacterium]|nr:hypothetical protein [Bacteroidota bacterium]
MKTFIDLSQHVPSLILQYIISFKTNNQQYIRIQLESAYFHFRIENTQQGDVREQQQTTKRILGAIDKTSTPKKLRGLQ